MEYSYLRVKTEEGERPVELGSVPVTVGRHETNSLVIKDSMASRFHCVIERAGEGYVLRDLQSRNGTFVNGQRVMIAALKHGDVVVIGAVQMRMVNHRVSTSLAGGEKGVVAEVDDLEVIATPVAVGKKGNGGNGGMEGRAAFVILRRAAEAMPERGFEADEISLINPRGVVVHEAWTGRGGVGEGANSEAVVLLRWILLVCARTHASDIHFEPRAHDYLLRIRMDGNLLDVTDIDMDLGTRLGALVKVMCELDTTQRQTVQEGHFASSVQGKGVGGAKGVVRRVDYRVSLVPSLHGQKMVIRIFDAGNAPAVVEELCLPKWIAGEVSAALGKEGGLVLICGPTGSGKTTTLYALLRGCGSSFRNIVTIEDPVEIQLAGTTQLPVDEGAGKGFAALLRSVLRQDPDVIMVGEVRDPETAKIALQASMTGHLVLSTIHTRDTVGTIFRLIDLGVDAYMVSQGLHVVIAQRLVRALCKSCKKPYEATAEDRKRMGKAGEKVRIIFGPAGCPKCLGTGYYGRRAVWEFLSTTEQVRELIVKSAGAREITEALGAGFVTLADSGYELVAGGITSVDEVEKSIGR